MLEEAGAGRSAASPSPSPSHGDDAVAPRPGECRSRSRADAGRPREARGGDTARPATGVRRAMDGARMPRTIWTIRVWDATARGPWDREDPRVGHDARESRISFRRCPAGRSGLERFRRHFLAVVEAARIADRVGLLGRPAARASRDRRDGKTQMRTALALAVLGSFSLRYGHRRASAGRSGGSRTHAPRIRPQNPKNLGIAAGGSIRKSLREGAAPRRRELPRRDHFRVAAAIAATAASSAGSSAARSRP
jgi:hypothetical protein